MGRHEKAVVGEYARLAARYDVRWRSYIAATVNESLRRLPDGPYERILDVGCGTGTLLESLSRCFRSATLHGVDPTREMLHAARAKLPAAAALSIARAEKLPFPDDSFDLLVSLSALHYFSDFDAALGEFNRVLQPGGRALVTDWCDDYLTCKLFDRGMRLLGKANFATLGSEACGALMRRSGFAEVRVERYRINWLWGLMTATARA